MNTPRLIIALLLSALALTVCAQEQERDDAMNRRYQSVRGRINAYADDLSWEERTRDDSLALARLALDKVRAVARQSSAFLPVDDVRQQLVLELASVEARVRALGKPLTGHAEPGRHEFATLSPIDLSPEPMQVYVPTSYDAERPTPLWVFLHGYDSLLNKANWLETMYSPEMQAQAEKQGAIVCLPYARSNTEFMGVGETEVLNAIGWMKRHYNIDDRRVILSGASMGGSGAYSIATHYPGRFCGLMGITGRYDYYLWAAIDRDRLPGFKQILADTDYVQAALDNLMHVPVLLFQGSGDARPFPLPEHSREMVRRLQAMGYEAALVEFPAGHYIWGPSFSHDTLSAWIPRLKAPVSPRRVRYGTFTLKYNEAYWVRIDAFERWGERAVVDATVTAPDAITLKTQNIAQLSLNLHQATGRLGPVTIRTGGNVHVLKPNPQGWVRVKLIADGAPSGGLRKTRDLCGPVRDAYRSRFLIVRGTQGEAEQVADAQEHAARLAREWVRFTQGRVHMAADTDVSDEQMRDCNLILVGGPENNRLVAQIADRLPIKMETDAYLVAGRRVPRTPDNGLLMVYPNPLNTTRYVVVAEGLPWGEYLDVNHKLDLVPDFIVFESEPSTGVTTKPRYLNPIVRTNRHIVAGFFDTTWRLAERLTWWADAD